MIGCLDTADENAEGSAQQLCSAYITTVNELDPLDLAGEAESNERIEAAKKRKKRELLADFKWLMASSGVSSLRLKKCSSQTA